MRATSMAWTTHMVKSGLAGAETGEYDSCNLHRHSLRQMDFLQALPRDTAHVQNILLALPIPF